MTQPTVGAWHTDAALTNISIAFLQSAGGFVSSRVFPQVGVQKQSDVYYEIDRGMFNRSQAKKRAPGTKVAEGGFDLTTASYLCEERGISKVIPDQVRANADPAVPPERLAAEFVAMQMMLEKEIGWAAAYFATSIWTTDITGVASSPSAGEVIHWSDATNGDPIGDIRTGVDTVLESTGFKPNKLTIGRQVFTQLIDHPDIQARISGGATTSQPSLANRNLLAQIFELDEVIVGEAIQNTAGENLTNSHSFILGKNALLSYSPPTPGLMIPSAGYTFAWDGYLMGTNEMGFVTDTIRRSEEDSDVVRGRSHYSQKLVAADLGYFFSGIVA